MRRMIVVGLTFFLVVPALRPEISLKIRGGANLIWPGDYNHGAEGRNAYVASIASGSPEGEFGSFGPGWDIAGEAFWNLNPYSSIGIEVGFLRFRN